MKIYNVEPSGVTQAEAADRKCWRNPGVLQCMGWSCMAWHWTEPAYEYAYVRMGRKPVERGWKEMESKPTSIVDGVMMRPWRRERRGSRLGRCGAVPAMAREASITPDVMKDAVTEPVEP